MTTTVKPPKRRYGWPPVATGRWIDVKVSYHLLQPNPANKPNFTISFETDSASWEDGHMAVVGQVDRYPRYWIRLPWSQQVWQDIAADAATDLGATDWNITF